MPRWYLRGDYSSAAQGYRRRLRSGGAAEAFQLSELVLAPSKFQVIKEGVTGLDLILNPNRSIISQAGSVWLKYQSDLEAGRKDGWAQLYELDKLWQAGRTDEIEPILATENHEVVFGWSRIVASVGNGQHADIPAIILCSPNGSATSQEQGHIISLEALRSSRDLTLRAEKLRHAKRYQWIIAFRRAGSKKIEVHDYVNHACAQSELRAAQDNIKRPGTVELWRLKSINVDLESPLDTGAIVHELELSKLYAPVNSTRLVSTGRLTTHQKYGHLRVIRDINHG